MTVNKNILMHRDFVCDFETELCNALEAAIDSEFEKGDSADFDFIDECAKAINTIRSGESVQLLPLISDKDFINKLKGKSKVNYKIVIALCAVFALVFSAGAIIKNEYILSVSESLSGFIYELFEYDKKPSEIKETESKETITSTQPLRVIGIEIETTPEFKTEYFVGERFSQKGLKVFAEQLNGERLLLNSGSYSVDISETFASKADYETVIINYFGFSESIEVRVIESIKTPKLNSVYVVFPDDFEFTVEDAGKINLEQMQVFAVYSDGKEEKLDDGEYTAEIEIKNSLFNKSVDITVMYQDCSCSFTVEIE